MTEPSIIFRGNTFHSSKRGRPLPLPLRVSTLLEDLRANRRLLDITQRAVAEEAGLVPSVVSRLESGKVSPTLSTVQAYAAALTRLVEREAD